MKERLRSEIDRGTVRSIVVFVDLFDGEVLDVFVYSLKKSRCCR